MVNDQLVYDRLVDVARKGKTIPYCDIAGLLGLDVTIPEDRTEIMRVLDNISYKENAEGRPLLSAVAVLPEIGYPGKGFFLLARELEANDFSDERSFYYYELKRVHEYWKNRSPKYSSPALPRVHNREIPLAVR